MVKKMPQMPYKFYNIILSQQTLMPYKFYDIFCESCLIVAFMEKAYLYIIAFKGLYDPTIRFISVLSGVRISPPLLCKQRGYGFSRSPFFVKNGCLLVALIRLFSKGNNSTPKSSKNQHINLISKIVKKPTH